MGLKHRSQCIQERTSDLPLQPPVPSRLRASFSLIAAARAYAYRDWGGQGWGVGVNVLIALLVCIATAVIFCRGRVSAVLVSLRIKRPSHGFDSLRLSRPACRQRFRKDGGLGPNLDPVPRIPSYLHPPFRAQRAAYRPVRALQPSFPDWLGAAASIHSSPSPPSFLPPSPPLPSLHAHPYHTLLSSFPSIFSSP
jgi:hypothetical protein